MAKPKGIDWSQVDWSLNNGQISRQLNVATKTVWCRRKKLGLPASTGVGQCAKEDRCKTNHLTSPVTQPIRNLDYEFACTNYKGRRKATKAYRNAVLETWGSMCELCSYWEEAIHNDVHHIVPLSQNGSNTIRNGIVLCSRCHAEVHANVRSIPESLLQNRQNLFK
jgi:5-methylcytosine-specific restriction endonuclease McrA